MVSRRTKAEAGQAGLGLAGLDNFGGLWDIRGCPWLLVPGSGVIRAG